MTLVYEDKLTQLYSDDCFKWLSGTAPNTIHGVVTDPPYGMLEYTPKELKKLREGRGGVWRIPPKIGGSERAPLPRFTVLSDVEIGAIRSFFQEWGTRLLPVLIPGAHVFVASSPLLSYLVSAGMVDAGYEKRGEIVRLVRTLRGGDRPKGAEEEFPGLSSMPRSCWEPWCVFRRPFQDTLATNLRKWGTGALRRPKAEIPFTDVIMSGRTPRRERDVAPHPSLKPQSFLRQVVYACLPLGTGTILDPFAGGGSTLAAAKAIGYRSIGIEIDEEFAKIAKRAIPRLAELADGLQLRLPAENTRPLVEGVRV